MAVCVDPGESVSIIVLMSMLTPDALKGDVCQTSSEKRLCEFVAKEPGQMLQSNTFIFRTNGKLYGDKSDF